MCLYPLLTLFLQVFRNCSTNDAASIDLPYSGELILETSGQKISMTGGELLLIGRNQLGTLTKTPLPEGTMKQS